MGPPRPESGRGEDMYGVFVQYNYYLGAHNRRKSCVEAAFRTREEAETYIRERKKELKNERFYNGGWHHEYGEWAIPECKIVGLRETPQWAKWYEVYASLPRLNRREREDHANEASIPLSSWYRKMFWYQF
jgi:hypothetical protein